MEVCRRLSVQNSAGFAPLLSEEHTVESIVASAKEALESAQSYKSYVEQALEALTPENMDGEVQLFSTKEHFAKLKFNFTEMETKQGFMQHLANDKENGRVAGMPEVKQLEEVTQREKMQLKAIKNKNETLRQQIVLLANSVAQDQEAIAQARQMLEEKLAQMEQDQREIETLSDAQQSAPEKLFVADTEITLSNAQAVLDEQLNEIAQLKQRQSELHLHKSTHESTLSSLADHSETVRSQLETAQRQLNQLLGDPSNVSEGRVEKERKAHEWATEMERAMESLSGIKIIATTDETSATAESASSFVVEFGAAEGALQLLFTDTQLTDAKLLSPPLNVSDIFQYALRTQNVPFLLRETKQRISNYQSLKREIDQLSESFAIVTNLLRNEVTVTFGGKDSGIECVLKVGMDYPLAHSGVTLQSVDDRFGVTREHITEMAGAPRTVEEWVTALHASYIEAASCQ